MSDPVRDAFVAWRKGRVNPKYPQSAEQIEWAAWQASRAAALEEAAQACEERGAQFDGEDVIASIAAELCAARIRAMVKP